MKRGRYKDAIVHYDVLQQKLPDNILVLNNLAWAYAQMKDDRALATAERAYKLAPDNASVADTIGALLVERGDAARGMELLEKAVKAAPNVAEIHYHLAQGWVKKGDKSKARGELERADARRERIRQGGREAPGQGGAVSGAQRELVVAVDRRIGDARGIAVRVAQARGHHGPGEYGKAVSGFLRAKST